MDRSATEEMYCAIGSFFLLLPIISCIVKDITYDCQYFNKSKNKRVKQIQEERAAMIAISSTECNVLLQNTTDGIDTVNHVHNKCQLSPTTMDKSSRHTLRIIQFDPVQLLIFNIFIITCYIILRTMAHIMDLRRDDKFFAAEMQDIYELCLRTTIIYVFGGIYNRKPFHHFLLYCTWFLFLYTIVFQVSPKAFQISSEMALEGLLIFVCLTILAIGLYAIVDNIFFIWSVKTWKIYTLCIVCAVIMYHICIAMSATENVEIHLHHHHWSFMLCLFVQSPKTSSFAIQALLIGICVHGITTFGAEALFQWTDIAPSNFGLDHCEKWQCARFKCEIPKQD